MVIALTLFSFVLFQIPLVLMPIENLSLLMCLLISDDITVAITERMDQAWRYFVFYASVYPSQLENFRPEI
jgi:hypothetical protein